MHIFHIWKWISETLKKFWQSKNGEKNVFWLVLFPPKSWGLLTKGCSCSLATAARLGDFLDGNFTLAGVFFISHVNPFIKYSSEDRAVSTEHSWVLLKIRPVEKQSTVTSYTARRSLALNALCDSALAARIFVKWCERDDFPDISETCLEQLVQNALGKLWFNFPC